MDIACWLLVARQLHRQSGMLDAQGDPFSAQFLEALVVPDLAANVADPFATNIRKRPGIYRIDPTFPGLPFLNSAAVNRSEPAPT